MKYDIVDIYYKIVLYQYFYLIYITSAYIPLGMSKLVCSPLVLGALLKYKHVMSYELARVYDIIM